jgi:hypothetical protein
MKKSKTERLALLLVLRSALFSKAFTMSRFEPMFSVYLDSWRRVNLKIRRLEN